MNFVEEARELQAELVRFRRELHRDPEVGLELPRTQGRILAELEGLDLEIHCGERTSSVVAVLRGGRPGPLVLLRGDMDALPVDERTGLDFASTNGAMHACGHDLHVAGLLGAVKLLVAHREELQGDVMFMFQPGEEGYGGAKVMLEEGLLDVAGRRPIAAYAIHVAPGPFGVFGTAPGTMMAGSNDLSIEVVGRGGHGSMPETAIDPVPALLEIGSALQAMVTREFSVFDPVVLSVTQLSAGTAINVIPERARLGATVRTLSAESLQRMVASSERLATGIATAHRCTAETEFEVLYPVTVNDEREAAFAIDAIIDSFGESRLLRVPRPAMGSEDFSFVLDEVPGCFLMLSCSPPDIDPATMAFNHSPLVVFDDAVLGDQAAALAELARRRLAVGADSAAAETAD